MKCEQVQIQRAEAIDKYDKNECYWKGKHQKLEMECNQLFEMNSQLKDDNNDLIVQIDKFNKRIKQLDNDKERDQEQREKRENIVTDLNKQI